MLLDASLLAALAERTLHLDCLDMWLEPRTEGAGTPLAGPGAIRMTADGRLHLTLYAVGQGEAAHAGPEPAWPGEDGFRLVATDTRGRRWHCPRVFPTRAADAHHGLVVRAEIPELHAGVERAAPTARRALELLFLQPLPLPACATAPRDGFAAARWPGGETLARFEACGAWVDAERTPHGVSLRLVPTSGALDECLARRATDALAFVLAEHVEPAVVHEALAGGERLTIHPPERVRWGSVLPPVIPRRLAHADEATWQLFRCYLAAIGPGAPHAVPRLATQWRRVLQAMAGTVETLALALPPAVETVLRLTTDTRLSPTEHETRTRWRAQAVRLAREAGCPEPIASRMDALLAGLASRSAAELLAALAYEGAVDHELVQAWRQLRPPGGPATDPEPPSPEALRAQVEQVLTLLYQLTFRAIGYRGWYRRYGRDGWTLCKYAGSGADGAVPPAPPVPFALATPPYGAPRLTSG